MCLLEKNQGLGVVLDVTDGLRCRNLFTSYELPKRNNNVVFMSTLHKNG